MRARAGAGPEWARHPWVPYAGPFVVFLLILSFQDYLAWMGAWEAPLRFAVMSLVTIILSRRVLDLRVASPLATLLLGAGVFAAWIAPDLIWPNLRSHWLFQNSVLGAAGNSLNARLGGDPLFLTFRFLRSVLVVPVVEELFWRGWLQRWLIDRDFESVPIGAYLPSSFWITVLLFAAEHGAFWDVGLIAGAAYGYWSVRTRRLGDCILAHAVTNACLSAYVIWTGNWRYWP
jgi:hypothetical protein